MFTVAMEYNRGSKQKQNEHGVSVGNIFWGKFLQRHCPESVFPGTVLVAYVVEDCGSFVQRKTIRKHELGRGGSRKFR